MPAALAHLGRAAAQLPGGRAPAGAGGADDAGTWRFLELGAAVVEALCAERDRDMSLAPRPPPYYHTAYRQYQSPAAGAPAAPPPRTAAFVRDLLHLLHVPGSAGESPDAWEGLVTLMPAGAAATRCLGHARCCGLAAGCRASLATPPCGAPPASCGAEQAVQFEPLPPLAPGCRSGQASEPSGGAHRRQPAALPAGGRPAPGPASHPAAAGPGLAGGGCGGSARAALAGIAHAGSGERKGAAAAAGAARKLEPAGRGGQGPLRRRVLRLRHAAGILGERRAAGAALCACQAAPEAPGEVRPPSALHVCCLAARVVCMCRWRACCPAARCL